MADKANPKIVTFSDDLESISKNKDEYDVFFSEVEFNLLNAIDREKYGRLASNLRMLKRYDELILKRLRKVAKFYKFSETSKIFRFKTTAYHAKHIEQLRQALDIIEFGLISDRKVHGANGGICGRSHLIMEISRITCPYEENVRYETKNYELDEIIRTQILPLVISSKNLMSSILHWYNYMRLNSNLFIDNYESGKYHMKIK